jgi:ornithine--oxo-acid transaminase
VWLWDVEDKKYLDCLSAYSAVNQGHCHPKILSAITQQAAQLSLCSRAFHHDQMGRFLKTLCEFSGFEKALLMNSGTEAVETALKIIRKWAYKIKAIPQDKAEIIVVGNNFHGRTISIIGFSTEKLYREDFGPFTEGFKIIPFGDIDSLNSAISDKTAAVLMEPIQGEAGILIPPKGYLLEVQKLCKKNNILLALDEIQTGFCRTGKRFCFQHELSEIPDLIIVGKALSGGFYPVSAVLSSHEIMDVIKAGEHGSTFGGNPLACAVSNAAIEVLVNEKLDYKAKIMGEYLITQLQKINSPKISEIRGRGLMIGVDINPKFGKAREYCEKMLEQGILIKDTRSQTLRIAPPLVIEKDEVDFLVNTLKNVLLA